MNWYISVLKQYAVFSGRARRTEYWMFVLCNVIVMQLLGMVDKLIGGDKEFISGIYSLAVLLPSLAVAVRRLHDTDRSGWWLLLVLVPIIGILVPTIGTLVPTIGTLVPIIGTLVLIYFMVCNGQQGPNRFGDDPKAAPSQGFIVS
ncbi:DUF805 domain-containing protein [Aeromonas veronii]|uniref:DUF805 domain-containing protein n=1 Tax=Aeromonas veronii TaxID=654 RepID=UPI003BA2E2FB